LNFGDQSQGVPSSAKNVTLMNNGNAPLVISNLVASAQFSTTGWCASIEPGATCAVPTVFTPTGVGPVTGSLGITHNGIGATSVGLRGDSADFSLDLPLNLVTLAPGAFTTVELTVTPLNGFKGTLPLTCTAPTELSCTLSASSVNLAGLTAQKITATIAALPTARKKGYSVALTGKFGGLEHKRTQKVTVQ
jgi:hypothetical protein